MEKNRKDSAEWCLNKAEEYLDSAKNNIEAERFYPAAEEIFRAVETTFEAILNSKGIMEIRYPGKDKPFKGRLALQFLIRDNLVSTGELPKEFFDKYLEIATELHSSGYMHGKSFKRKELSDYLIFAERLFFKAKGMI